MAPTDELPRLGPFVRATEVYFALVVVTILGYAFLMKPNDFAYDITLVRIIVVMAAAVRSIWLIERRADTARQFIVGSMLVVIALSVVDIFLGGEYGRIASVVTMPVLIAGGVAYFGGSAAIVLYFAFSPHAKAVFTQPLRRDAPAV